MTGDRLGSVMIRAAIGGGVTVGMTDPGGVLRGLVRLLLPGAARNRRCWPDLGARPPEARVCPVIVLPWVRSD